MMNQITNSEVKKVNIVVDFLETVEKDTKTQFSKEHGISRKVLEQCLDLYISEARSLLKKKRHQAATTKRKSIDETNRGYKGRNGRVLLVRHVVEDMGVDAKSGDMIKEINERSKRHDLPEITRSAAYVLISMARKAIAQEQLN